MTLGQEDRLSVAALGARVRLERQGRRLSLEDMASRSGVSRSMVSAIERGAKVPTVLVLDRIANALGVSVSRLLDEEKPDRVVYLPKDQQKSAGGGEGWQRRICSPVVHGIDFEMGRTHFEPGADAGVFAPHLPGWTEYYVVERGMVEVTLDGQHTFLLKSGDSLYFESNVTHAFRNPGNVVAVAYVVMSGARAAS